MGKSTLAKKIAWDWAKRLFTAVNIVFFVFLKLVNPCDAIENVIIEQMPALEGMGVTKDELTSILNTFGNRCLLILDGLDEHALGQNEDVCKIIRGQKFLYCNVILTSRPHSTREIKKYFDTVIRIDGFTNSEARKFASRIVPDKKKVDSILKFSPSNNDSQIYDDTVLLEHFSDYSRKLCQSPILLSFMCLLVREDDIDLSNKTIDRGEIYARMVRCLYKKFVVRKNIEYNPDTFTETLRKIGKLALQTLLSRNSLLQRSQVVKELGEDIFDYGLLIGHEDFRLLGTTAADIFVTFPHRSIQEFLGAFYFMLMLNAGESIESLLGSDCEEPIFMMNPLFLQFILWLLYNEWFPFCSKDKVIDLLQRYITVKIDKFALELIHIEIEFPALKFPGLEGSNEMMPRFLEGILAKCRNTRQLKINEFHCVNWVLTSIGHLLKQINIMKIHGTVYGQRIVSLTNEKVIKAGNSKLTAASLNRKVVHNLNSFNIEIKNTCWKNPIDILRVVLGHCERSDLSPSVYLDLSEYNRLELSDCFGSGLSELHLDGIFMNVDCTGQLPVCPLLTHLSFTGIEVTDSILFGLRKAIHEGKFPKLTYLSLATCEFQTKRKLATLFQSQCSTLTHLDLHDLNFDLSDLQFLASTCPSSQMEKSVLPELSSLGITFPTYFDSDSCSVTTLFQYPWIRLKSLTIGDIDAVHYDEIAKAIDESKLPNLTELRLSVKWGEHVELGKIQPEKIPLLESLALFRFITSPEDLEELGNFVVRWNLTELDISHNRGIQGMLHVLVRHNFPSLKRLTLENNGLNCKDLSSLAEAKVKGRLAMVEHLDITCNPVINAFHCLTKDPETREKIGWKKIIFNEDI